MTETKLSVLSSESLVTLFGVCDQHVRKIREAMEVSVSVQDGRIHIEGNADKVARATETLEQLQSYAHRHGRLTMEDVERAIATALEGGEKFHGPPMEVFKAGRTVRPRTAGQGRFVDAMLKHDIVFSSGPAGTGKTYLAVARAVSALKTDQIRKVVLCRPAVEAGESLGFLPGDLQAKINPYLRPLLDALAEMMDYDTIQRLKEQDIIEVIPLAYMRGRTLNEAFIILDEAQNTTIAQMKMFLTRMGCGSKIVVSGDTSQIDLPPHTRSGLIDALERLSGIEGIAMVKLSRSDIVRHALVQRIVSAYERGGPGSSVPGRSPKEKKRHEPPRRGDKHG